MKIKQQISSFLDQNKWEILTVLSTLSIALAINALFLIIPPPVLITRLLFNFRLDVAVLFVVFLGLVFSRTGVVWSTISLTLTLILFIIPLVYKWQTAGYYGYLIGGLLPWSDAHGYYSGAQHLLYDGYLTSWATRRPLFSGFLAVLFSITSSNLQVSLGILAILNGLAVYLASREIQKIFGPFTATTFLAICYWYYCAYAGTTASEQLGLCFGSLGTAFLICGTQQKESIKWVAYGLFLLTLALNARAGAFFILPILALWLGINYGKSLGWKKPILVGIAITILGMMANLFMVKMIGPPQVVPFSNYSYTLYGLASGNAGWTQVLRDYPEVKEEEVFGLAIQKIKENPSLFLIGILRSYQDYFTMTRGQFSFLGLVNDRKNIGNQLLWILTCLALISALFKYKQGHSGLILAAFVGILLSVSLVPPVDANFMRAYAVTIPFTAYIASTGLAFLNQPLQKIGLSVSISRERSNSPDLLPSFSAMLLILCFAGPLLVKSSVRPQMSALSLSCSPLKEEMIFITNSGSNVKLTADQDIKESYLPNIRIADFKDGVEAGPLLYPFLTDTLLSLEPGQTISVGMYQKNGAPTLDSLQDGYIVTNGALLKPGTHQICATASQNAQLNGLFFYDESEGNEAGEEHRSILHQNPALAAKVRNLYGLGILLIYVFTSLSYFGAWSTSSAKKLLLLGGTVLIFAGILVYLHANALYPVAWERNPLNIEDAVHRGGYSYELPLGIHWMDRRNLGESPAIIYEDGIPLKYPNTPPFSVDRRGKGRFSIEEGNVILSSSDNSDPRNNGRYYEIYWPIPIYPLVQMLCYILAIVALLLMHLHRIKMNKESSIESDEP